MSRQPILGILITYYNEQTLLQECLESLVYQMRDEDEIIIYDDASQYPAKDYISEAFRSRVKLIRGETNLGLGAARNEALKLSRSEYIHFHDADDLFMPDWVEKVNTAILESNPDIIFTEAGIYENGRITSTDIMDLQFLNTSNDLILMAITRVILSFSSISRRNLILSIGGFRDRKALSISEDYDFHIRIANKNPRYACILKTLVLLRKRANSLSRDAANTPRAEAHLGRLQALQMFIQSYPLSSKYKDEIAEQAAIIGSTLFNIGKYLEAEKAFLFAKQCGNITYKSRRSLYRWVARLFGPMFAEYATLFYRQASPLKIKILRRFF